MRFDEVKELIKLINDSDLSYFEMKDDKEFIKLDKSITRNYISNNSEVIESKSLNKLAITELSDDLDIKKENKEKLVEELKYTNDSNKNNEENLESIVSPIVGTFYEATSPEEESFVSVGQRVTKGEVVCIVEAMKLMNEISAEFDCEIVSILGKNGEMVQYGEPLFKVRRV